MPLSKNTVQAAVAFMALLTLGPQPGSAQGGPDQPVEFKELSRAPGGKPPTPIKQTPPVYPAGMSRAGLVGTVMVQFVIDAEGAVRNPFVMQSNNPWFERPAVDAILQWKFKPAEVNGRPVNCRVAQSIEFRMEPGFRAENLWEISKGRDHKKLPAEFQWDRPPVPVSTMFPVYPYAQLKAGTKGRARVSYVVGPDGRVLTAKVQEATVPEFGQAVLAMIDGWRFKPATRKDGTPCYVSLGGEYDFRPNGEGEVPVSDEARDILRALEKKPESIASLKDLDQPPKPLSRRPPSYPSALLKDGRPGEAMIEFFVDKNGDAQLPRIISSTAPEFGYAAVQAVATWRFEVPKKGGKPVVTRARIPIGFALGGPKPEGQRND